MARTHPMQRSGLAAIPLRERVHGAALSRALRLAIGGPALLIILASFLYPVLLADRVFPGVRAMGLDVGGYPVKEAGSLLFASASQRARQPVELVYGDKRWIASPADLGQQVEVDSLLDRAYSVGREGPPWERWGAMWGSLLLGRIMPWPDLTYDLGILRSYLQDIAANIDGPVVDSAVKIEQGLQVAVIPSQIGRRLEVEASASRITDALSHGETRIQLAVTETQPGINPQDLLAAAAAARLILSGPIHLRWREDTWELKPNDLASLISINSDNRKDSKVTLLDQPLETWAKTLARRIDRPPSSARFSWNGGQLKVIRNSEDGQTMDVAATVGLVKNLAMSVDRSAVLPVSVVRPAVIDEDGPKLGIKELINRASTSFAGSVPEKAHNIRLAASRLNGVVVPPGGMFSFNQEIGPTTLANGYRTGWGITLTGQQVQTVPAVAGGICQVATTLFQPMFWAGYQLEERFWHLYWIQSYGVAPMGMKGLDATVDEDAGLDLKFINPTKDYLLIQAWTEGNSLHFGLYGTKPTWKVEVDGPHITNVIPANRATVSQDEPTMPYGRRLQVEAAQDGFEVTINRRVIDGDSVRELRLKSKYLPSRNLVLVGTKGRPPDVAPQTESPPPGPAPAGGGEQ